MSEYHLHVTVADWLPIPGYEGIYDISRDGRIWHRGKLRYLKLTQERSGYQKVSLRRAGVSKFLRVHQLVAAAFLPRPPNATDVNHIDCNKSNNAVENLEWCSRLHNVRHAAAAGLTPRGERHGLAKLDADKVRAIRAAAGSHRHIAEQFGISRSHVCGLRNRRFWGHVE